MKTWVYSQLANYYTIAEMNAKLEALQKSVTDGDKANAEEIEKLSQTLKSAVENLTTAYQKAIAEAITENDGMIDSRIQNEIAAVNTRIDNEVKSLSDKMKALEERIKEIEGRIKTIDEQISSINETLIKLQQLEKAISALEGEDESIKESLGEAEKALEGKIADLKAYVDNELQNTKDWASATFATLLQYQSLCDEVAALKQLLESLDINSVKEALDSLETSMKTWVNTQLANYYTIAEMNAKLEALQNAITDGDSANAEEIDTLKQNLETAKSELTDAYNAAIETAVNQNNGVINQKIADDIKAATDAIQEKLDGLSARIDAIENRLAALEAAVAKIISGVQSVVVVPDFSDGSVRLSNIADNKIRFEVYPLEAAEAIAEAGPSIFSLDYVETLTKSSEDFVNLPVTAVVFSGKTLMLTVDGTDIPETIISGSSSASARLKISDGTNTRSSEYFPIYKQFGSDPSTPGIAVTGDASEITAYTAKITGWHNLTDVDEDHIHVYAMYSLINELSIGGSWIQQRELLKDNDNKYSAMITQLPHNATIYYRTLIFVGEVKIYNVLNYSIENGEFYLGEIKTFTTSDITASITTGEATEISNWEATLKGAIEADAFLKPYFFYSDTYTTAEELLSKGHSIGSSGTFIGEGEFSGKISGGLQAGTKYYYIAAGRSQDARQRFFYGDVKTFTTAELPSLQAVDLGLSVKWANMNVGASSQVEYGDYFAWGETEPKDYYNWSNYKWCVGNPGGFTKYCYYAPSGYEGFTDNKTTLDPEDDAAHVNWGDNWRMPTDEEWEELRECTWKWTKQNGVNGIEVTGINGNSIFLPAAGRWEIELENAGEFGYYWSSTLWQNLGIDKASNEIFSPDDIYWEMYCRRFYGCSVRPVYGDGSPGDEPGDEPGDVPDGNIEFADENVKNKLVRKFDTDGDEELSYAEAANVTSGENLKAAFGAVKTYQSFDEFQYFIGITTIPDEMFAGWELTSIKLPDSITSLGERMFDGCTNLNTITLPSKLNSIGREAFHGWTGLQSITIPSNIYSIEYGAFQGCSNLTSITISDSVTYIGREAFKCCSGIQSIILPNKATQYGEFAFEQCNSLTSISIPSGTQALSEGMFYCCANLVSIEIPQSVTFIGNRAFFNCAKLNKIIIPIGVFTIDWRAFEGCVSATELTIPESVEVINESAFENCSSLTRITILATTPPNGSSNMFNNTNNCPIYVPADSLEDYQDGFYWIDYADRYQAIPE